jgi:hypothetical protein
LVSGEVLANRLFKPTPRLIREPCRVEPIAGEPQLKKSQGLPMEAHQQARAIIVGPILGDR